MPTGFLTRYLQIQPYSPASLIDSSLPTKVSGVPVKDIWSIVFTYSRIDVSRIMLRIYMRAMSPNSNATSGMYAIRSQNTSAKE